MHNVYLQDCVFIPGDTVRPVEEVLADEEAHQRSGTRWRLAYDEIPSMKRDATLFRQRGYAHVTTAPNQTPSDLAIAAVQRLLQRQGLAPSDVDGFIYFDTNPWPEDCWVNLACRIAETVGMRTLRYRAYLTQMNCTSSIAAMEAVYHLLRARPDLRWFVVAGGDCIATHHGEPRVVHNDIFGDAGSAALLGRQGARIEYIRCRPVPIAGRRYAEDRKTLLFLWLHLFRWSMREVCRALDVTGRRLQEFTSVLTNQELLYERMRSAPDMREEVFHPYRRHVRHFGMTHAHMVMEQLEFVLSHANAGSILMHTAGLGTSLATMVIHPSDKESER